MPEADARLRAVPDGVVPEEKCAARVERAGAILEESD
jgi:hypothetical protein